MIEVIESASTPGHYVAWDTHEDRHHLILLDQSIDQLRELYGAIGSVLQAHDHDAA